MSKVENKKTYVYKIYVLCEFLLLIPDCIDNFSRQHMSPLITDQNYICLDILSLSFCLFYWFHVFLPSLLLFHELLNTLYNVIINSFIHGTPCIITSHDLMITFSTFSFWDRSIYFYHTFIHWNSWTPCIIFIHNIMITLTLICFGQRRYNKMNMMYNPLITFYFFSFIPLNPLYNV